MLEVFKVLHPHSLYVLGGGIALFLVGYVIYMIGRSKSPPKWFLGRFVQFVAILAIVAGAAGPWYLGSRLETGTQKQGTVKGSAQTLDLLGRPRTIVNVEGYQPATVLTFDDHRELKVGDQVSFVEFVIDGQVYRLAP